MSVNNNGQAKEHLSTLEIVSAFFPFVWSTKTFSIKCRLLFSLLLVVVTMALNLGVPIIFKYAVNMLSDPTNLKENMILLVIASYGLFWTFGRYSEKLRQMLLYKPLARTMTEYSLHVFRHLHSLSLKFHLQRETGAVTSSIHRAQLAIAMVVNNVMLNIIPDILEVLLAFVILWHLYSLSYGLLVLSVLGLFLLITIFTSNYATKFQQAFNKIDMGVSARIVDSLLNVDTVKLFNNQIFEQKQADKLLTSSSNALVKMFLVKNIAFVVQTIIVSAGLIIITYKAGQDVLADKLQVGDFILINAYLIQFLFPLSRFGELLHNTREFLSKIEASAKLLKHECHIHEIENAPDIIIQKADIHFNEVSFSYDESRSILNNISFSIFENTSLAIVGPSGSGKSTIARLLLRFFDVSSGVISISGQDISRVTKSSLRRCIGVVPQDIVLFNDTLRYNLIYGTFDATEEDINRAIKMAHLEMLIHKLPQKLETMVGERGLKLSGGERQRIGIARALIKKPKILLFDEATSSLDTVTEKEIQANIEELSKNITTVIIAHRLSTIVHADNILVLKNGNIVESGKHKQLLKDGELYSTLWKSQLKHHD
ncbi:ATP-binding cassette domain-containing protein [Candidatus Berkiella cookevillensis]|uniref:ATP-binding cassette domain-containing protein n=1 Tax=Candidatus Berkiella cookevillensis TaxID=437022 RepID=A0A0Q9YJY1_9GAMM|nr:ATP-binding cassette domain-containing protein [Candidatus Berkiella cookevillensis]MCS5707349.1 ATP-binding cassette domain-containing protein [Candidatus Berkiella cookevillensis]